MQNDLVLSDIEILSSNISNIFDILLDASLASRKIGKKTKIRAEKERNCFLSLKDKIIQKLNNNDIYKNKILRYIDDVINALDNIRSGMLLNCYIYTGRSSLEKLSIFVKSLREEMVNCESISFEK